MTFTSAPQVYQWLVNIQNQGTGIIKHYRDDLFVYDKEIITENEGKPFKWMISEFGTHICFYDSRVYTTHRKLCEYLAFHYHGGPDSIGKQFYYFDGEFLERCDHEGWIDIELTGNEEER